MPLLTYPTSDFVPFTKILSADMNGKLNAIKTLLNVTGLDDTNIQNVGITRATKLKTGTASYVIINDGTGAMSEEATLAISRGGLGTALMPTVSGQVIQVNAGGTGFTLAAPPTSATGNIFNYYRFN